jgi:hypothetical protein
MLTKCMNPPCSASFLQLAEGQLFRLETGQTVGSSDARALEYFWLCEACSAGMTLHLEQDGRVMPTRLREMLRTGSAVAFMSANRENGRFLHGVTFLRSNHPRST